MGDAMTKCFSRFALVVMICQGTAFAQYQEPGERAAQARLPQSRAAVWGTLRKTRIGVDEVHGMFTASHPPEVKALVGKTITLPGFINPLDAATRGNHFLFSKYTPVCAFCPPGEPNEVVEIRTTRPIIYSAKLITISGKFTLQNNGENGLFFQMSNAEVR